MSGQEGEGEVMWLGGGEYFEHGIADAGGCNEAVAEEVAD
jgi:hypothetical protein